MITIKGPVHFKKGGKLPANLVSAVKNKGLPFKAENLKTNMGGVQAKAPKKSGSKSGKKVK